MSADPRGTESAAGRRWYLEVSGRRAGPFAWTVLCELAQAGALGADDRVWRMGLASWSRAADLAELTRLMREPAPARTFKRADTPGRIAPGAGSVRLLAGLCALLLLVIAVGVLFADHVIDRISAERFRPPSDSLTSYGPHAVAFEGRYPFLAELRRVEPARFDRLDEAVRLRFRRGAPATELNGLVAETASDIERERLPHVDDGSALRLLVELRTAARRFQSSDPAQCVAILRLQSGASPIRSAAALAAISPALVGLLDAPARPQATAESQRNALQDAPDVHPKLDCDHLLLLYDTAVASSPDAGAAFIRALQDDAGR
jgi:hypothetical protein